MDKKVGVLGGGQLGRMFTEAANDLNVTVVSLDAAGSPAKQVNAAAEHVDGKFTDPAAIRSLASLVDVLTIEIEHVDTRILEELSGQGHSVHPSWQTIRTIQDKYAQKEHLTGRGIATAESLPVDDPKNIKSIVEQLGGFPAMLKARTDAYDGRGNYPLRSEADIPDALDALKGRPLYVEGWADFAMELAVMVVKVEDSASENWEAATLAFPAVETIHQDSICALVYCPPRGVADASVADAQALARRAVASFQGKGIFGVELFLLNDGKLLINEIAPRPHNSGHYTIEACPMSQFEAHLRAILGLPIPPAALTADRAAVMVNVLGGAGPRSHLELAEAALSVPRAAVHLYGKGDGRPGRKMGHVTVTGAGAADVEERVSPLIDAFDRVRQGTQTVRKFPLLRELAGGALRRALVPTVRPLVAVTMGSDSDKPTLEPGLKLLEEFGVPCFVTITSAHRTPQRMFEFAERAAGRGIKVIIAAAGGAAHLPGMVAAVSRLPVIGVPVRASTLDGLDSLLSIVQMPRGCPVATVAINNSINAAQLAIRILATEDAALAAKLEKHLRDQTQTVEEKALRMEQGWAEY